ncbi:hypothetical protein DXV76_20300 [Rhodobacteraceae bacterium CCMM004]|nr:hypothetical protein DXV76_20300 [Rhodobacteraceae bacterium CCMM004]
MIIGDGEDWLSAFKGFDARFVERLCEIVPITIGAVGPDANEDDITHDLRHRFHLDPIIRRLFYSWETQFEPPGYVPNGAYTRDGRIDLVLFWSQDPSSYLAYEAKRLHVQMPSGFQALSGKYVNDGLKRYATEKYSEGLPFGGMLGYVLDGDLEGASNKIAAVLTNNPGAISLSAGPNSLPEIGAARRFETRHIRPNGTEIHVAHSLVDCSNSHSSCS